MVLPEDTDAEIVKDPSKNIDVSVIGSSLEIPVLVDCNLLAHDLVMHLAKTFEDPKVVH